MVTTTAAAAAIAMMACLRTSLRNTQIY